jgi:hypothetical protein
MAPTGNQPSAGPASGSPDGSAPAVVTLRPIASGLPFGFFGLALAAALIGAQGRPVGSPPPRHHVATHRSRQ